MQPEGLRESSRWSDPDVYPERVPDIPENLAPKVLLLFQSFPVACATTTGYSLSALRAARRSINLHEHPHQALSFRRRCSLAFVISLMSAAGRISKMLPYVTAGCWPISWTAWFMSLASRTRMPPSCSLVSA